MEERKSSLQQLDFTLLFLLFVLMCISLMAIYSGTTEQYVLLDDTYFVRRQVVWFAIGVILMLGAMSIDYEMFKNFSIPLYAIGMVLLLLVHFFGEDINGAQRWISVAGIMFQPSEFVKIFVILALAHLLYRITQTPRAKSFTEDAKVIGKILAVGGPPFFLILIQPDLGTALVIGAVMMTMILMSGVTWRMIGLLTSLVVAAIGFLVILHNYFYGIFTQIIKTHQMNRIYGWLDPAGDTSGLGYQLFHALQGIGAGQLYGMGFTQGAKTQGGDIPELHTDFVFTVIGEEFGFVGATVLIIVYFLLLYRMVMIAFNCNNSYGTYLVAGVVGLLVFQIFQNIGMTIGVMPITGLALPFISYGGSALLTNMIAVGIVLNVNLRTRHYMFGEDY
ncbi:rod shape-determining protein RodA [Alteribacter natronophilus]|uniref:rod shape-determining protein RodA n=1 Tax=Alteribacter natronophilus TaxID=2583810 RepID=UPI00110E352E|nr:rod shape-determining protein RodA [Alteribacter natronophilus]TMW71785.1 rod shape-determining protein RodA [Alteribacter natronophilus]